MTEIFEAYTNIIEPFEWNKKDDHKYDKFRLDIFSFMRLVT